MKNFKTRHGSDIKHPLKSIEKALKELETLAENHQKNLESQPLIQDQVSDLFETNIGDDYPDSRIAEIYKIGETRYPRKIPPGFKDASKTAPFGDLIAWFQMIDFAIDEEKPIIMVTDDSRGDDWFYKSKNAIDGQTQLKGPRPELMWEMREKANVDFYLYRTGEFIGFARSFLNLENILSDYDVKQHEERDKDIIELEDVEDHIADYYRPGRMAASIDFGKIAGLSAIDFDKITGMSAIDFGKIAGLSAIDFGKIAGLSAIDFGKIAGLSAIDFDKIAGLSAIDFGKIAGLSAIDFDKITGMSAIDFEKIAGLQDCHR